MALSHQNMHVVAYAWQGLGSQCRRSQRALLSDARRQLRDIPPGTLGLICVQADQAVVSSIRIS